MYPNRLTLKKVGFTMCVPTMLMRFAPDAFACASKDLIKENIPLLALVRYNPHIFALNVFPTLPKMPATSYPAIRVTPPAAWYAFPIVAREVVPRDTPTVVNVPAATPLPVAVAGSVKKLITVAITLSAGLAASAVGAPPLTNAFTLQSPLGSDR